MPESESDEKAQKKKIISISGKEAPASFFCALIEIFAVIIKVFATTVKVFVHLPQKAEENFNYGGRKLIFSKTV